MTDERKETFLTFDADTPAPSAADAAEEAEGERFSEQGLIGRGGMGEVHRVRDRVLGRSVVRKEIRADRAASVGNRQRFLTEARITAQLAHPGVVPVHDVGTLEDGRPYYTMREVKGLTLAEAIGDLHAGRAARSLGLRQLLGSLLRACETVAYAHSRGIVHRDLKPDNIMLGEFGAVMVIDWGLARALGSPDDVLAEGISGADTLTRAGRVLGTPGYLPPEQAAGALAAIGPHSDVFSLGAILYEILCGRPAYPGSVDSRLAAVRAGPPEPLPEGTDAELGEICTTAMAADPAARFPSAVELVEALSGWLAGARRRERALEAVAEADTCADAFRAASAEASALREEAAAILEPLKTYDDAALKKPGWAKEDAAVRLDAQAELAGVRFIERLHGALRIEPDLPEAHARLAAWYRERHEDAELRSDLQATIRCEELLRTHDRGEHSDYLRGEGTLTLRTVPPMERARVSRFVLRDRRLVPELVETCGSDRLRELRLPAGSYLVELEAADQAPARYPVLLERGGEWAEPPVPLLPVDSLAEDDCYVPAGPFMSGGDPEAADGLPSRRVWVGGFVMKRFPVTNAEYLAFLNDLVGAGRSVEAEQLAPRRISGTDSSRQHAFGRRSDGTYILAAGQVEEPWRMEGPVVLVSWRAARAYCAWKAAREGLPWRLPHALEWEKAARGVDGRHLPWGNHLEPTWAASLYAFDGPPRVCPVTDFPTDESPYGVRGLAGNVRDWIRNEYRRAGHYDLDAEPGRVDDDDVIVELRGGAAWNSSSLLRPATRFGIRRGGVTDSVGFRLVRAVPAGSRSPDSG